MNTLRSPAAPGGAWTSIALALQRALSNKELAKAEQLLEALKRTTAPAGQLDYFGGVLAHRQQRYDEATERLSAAVAAMPTQPTSWFWLGNAERARGRLDAAAVAYRHAHALAPTMSDAAFNLGLCHERRDDATAGAWFVRAAQLAPMDADAHQAAVDCAGRLVGAGLATAPVAAGPEFDAPPLPVSFIVCSITPAKLAALRASIEERWSGRPWELIPIHDARSLCEGYTRGMRTAKGEIVVFCHDDILFASPDFAARLQAALDDADLVGVAGATRVDGPAVAWSGRPHVHGRITHQGTDGTLRPGISSLSGPRIDNAAALDGLFIAARRDAARRVGFDAERFDGFHLYDLDFSYRAHRDGLRVRLQCDLLVVHASRGNFDAAYWHYADRFVEKFPELGKSPPRSPVYFETRVACLADVPRVFDWLSCWITAAPELR